MARPKFKRWVSPTGMAKMSFIENPCPPFEGKGDPSYQVRVLLDDTKENRAWVEKVVETAIKEAKDNNVRLKKVFHNPFIMPEDVDEDDFVPQNGKDYAKYDEDHKDKIIFTTKSKFAPGRIDAARNSLPEDVRIFGGDTIRVKFEASPYVSGANNGITLRLVTAQLVEKNTSFTGGGGTDTDGFDDIDGYVAEPAGDEDEDF